MKNLIWRKNIDLEYRSDDGSNLSINAVSYTPGESCSLFSRGSLLFRVDMNSFNNLS